MSGLGLKDHLRLREFLALGTPLGKVGTPVPAFSFSFVGASSLPANTSFARADAVATYIDGNGNLATAALNTPRFNYDFFSKRAVGYLGEPGVTNSIRNNSAQGVVAGTPGTPPTNWTVATNSNGLSTQIVGSGTQNNIDYVDIRFFGTTTGTGECQVYYDATNQIASGNGTSWEEETYLSLVGGSNANITSILQDIDQRDASNVFLAFRGSGQNIYSNIIPSTLLRFTDRLITNQASVAFVSPVLRIATSGSGVAIDITIRFGLPQLAVSAISTSVIRTTNAAVTRNADQLQFTGAVATLLASSSYSVIARFNNTQNSNFALLGANGANYPGLGFIFPNFTSSNGPGNKQLNVATTTFSFTQQNLLGVTNGPTRSLTANGGSLRGGTTASDSNNIPVGPYVGTGFSSGYAANGNIASINIYSVPLTQAQLEALTNPTETTAWGDSLSAGTGSLSPTVNYGYVGYLNALTQQPVNGQGFAGQGSTFIKNQMVADTYHTNDNVIIEVGRNNTGSQATILADIALMVAHLAGNTRFVILSIINSTAENSAAAGANLTNYNNIIAINAAIAAAYPNNYVDVRSAIVTASSGTNDAPAATYMYQGSVHPNDAGYQVMATQIYNFGHGKSWPGY